MQRRGSIILWVSFLACLTLLCAVALHPRIGVCATQDKELTLLLAGVHGVLPPASTEKPIGSDGGTISLGGVSVTIPAGALDTRTMITLSRASAAHGLTPKPSMAYTLDVPDNPCIHQPMTVSIRTGAANGTTSVGFWDAYDDGGNTNATLPTILPAQVQDGVATFAIPRTDVCPSTSNSPADINQARADATNGVPTRSYFSFLVISGYLHMQSAHFRVNYPSSLIGEREDVAQQILNYAESAYNKLSNLGFKFDTAITWPMALNVNFGMDERNGETAIPLSGKASQYICLNANICATDKLNLLKVTIGHEFFHAVQHTYDPRAALRIRHTWTRPVFLWLAEASSVWFESRMLESSTYVPDVFVNNIDRKNAGLEIATDRSTLQDNGYWASGFLRYLTTKKSDFLLASIWDEVRAEGTMLSDYSDLTALIRADGGTLDAAIDWQKYLSQTMSGTTGYAGWPLPATNQTWMTSDFPTMQFTTSLSPFSGEKWLIGFNNSPLTEKFWIRASAVDPDITYDIYRSRKAEGPFTPTATLNQDRRQDFTVSQGDVFLITAVNANTSAPYQTPETASVVFGYEGQCSLCDNMPEKLDMTRIYGITYWYTQDTNLLVADAALFDNGDPYRLMCYDLTTGKCKLGKEYYESHNLLSEAPYDEECRIHGVQKKYYEDAHLLSTVTYVHGVTIGPVTLYDNIGGGYYRQSGNYVAGERRDGLWSTYDPSGTLIYTCTYSNGTWIECHEP